MEHTLHHSNKVELNDRTLWFDGDSSVKSDDVARLIAKGIPSSRVFVDEITEHIRQFNRNVSPDQRITVKESVRDPSLVWNLPEEYANLDIYEWMLDRLEELNVPQGENRKISREAIEYCARCAEEYNLYEAHGLFDVLRALIYIINTLRARNVVWGVGRGSSVSSFLLYLAGVHDINSVKYDLDIHEFLPPTDGS